MISVYHLYLSFRTNLHSWNSAMYIQGKQYLRCTTISYEHLSSGINLIIRISLLWGSITSFQWLDQVNGTNTFFVGIQSRVTRNTSCERLRTCLSLGRHIPWQKSLAPTRAKLQIPSNFVCRSLHSSCSGRVQANDSRYHALWNTFRIKTSCRWGKD